MSDAKPRRQAEQLPFVVILARDEGARRFRTTVLADDRERAVKKAMRIAKGMLGYEVELVQPERGMRGPSALVEQDNVAAAC